MVRITGAPFGPELFGLPRVNEAKCGNVRRSRKVGDALKEEVVLLEEDDDTTLLECILEEEDDERVRDCCLMAEGLERSDGADICWVVMVEVVVRLAKRRLRAVDRAVYRRMSEIKLLASKQVSTRLQYVET